MGLDRTLRARLVVVAGPGSWASGTMVEDCVHVLFHKTPKEEEGVQVTPHKVDASRVAKHTKLELRLLPDGLMSSPSSVSSSSSPTTSWWPTTAHALELSDV